MEFKPYDWGLFYESRPHISGAWTGHWLVIGPFHFYWEWE